MFDVDEAPRRRNGFEKDGGSRASSLLALSRTRNEQAGPSTDAQGQPPAEPAEAHPSKPWGGQSENGFKRWLNRKSQSTAIGSASPAPSRQGIDEAQPVARHEPAHRPAVASASHRSDATDWQPLVEPGAVLLGLVRSRWLILACTVAGAALGVLVALNTPKVYLATTDLLIDPRDLQIVDRELSQSGFSSDAALALIQNQMRIMTSGNVFQKVVDELDLIEDPEFNGQGGGISLNPLAALRGLLAERSAGERDPGMIWAVTVDNLARSVSVTRDGATFVVTIWAEARSPEKAALIANSMSSSYLETSAEFQAVTAGRATNELTGRLDELRRSVQEAESKVEAFKAENGIIDAQGRLISDDEIVKLNDQLSIARARTAELRARAASAGALDVDAVVDGILPEQVNSGAMGQLRAQYAALQQEADRLAVRLGPRHPQRLAADVQLRSARDQIAGELRRINSSVQVELSRAQQLENDLAARLELLKSRQGDLSSEMVALRELERAAASSRAVYEAFLLRARETGEQENLNTANITIISPATAPLRPSGMSRSSIALLGLILGLATGVAIGLARGAWRSLSNNAALRAPRRTSVPPATSHAPAAIVPVAAPAPAAETAQAGQSSPTGPAAPEETASVPFPWQEPSRKPISASTTAPRKMGRHVPPLASYAAQSAKRLDEAVKRHAGTAPAAASPRGGVRESLREFRAAVDEFAATRRQTP